MTKAHAGCLVVIGVACLFLLTCLVGLGSYLIVPQLLEDDSQQVIISPEQISDNEFRFRLKFPRVEIEAEQTPKATGD